MIDREEVIRIAGLANLKLSKAEVEEMREDLDRILQFVEELNAMDVPDVQMENIFGEDKLPLREDKTVTFPADDLIELAPERRERFYEVPKIIDEDDSGGI